MCATALQRPPHNRGAAAVSTQPPLPPTPAVPPMCIAHPRPTGPVRRSHSPLEEDPKSLQEARFWQNKAISLSQAAGRQLEWVRMESAFSFLHSRGNVGQVTPLADAAALSAASALDGFPANTSGSQDRRCVCGLSSPMGCRPLKDNAHCRQVWERHLVGYLGLAGLGLWTGSLPTSASEPISWSPCPVPWSEEGKMTKSSEVPGS